MIFFRQRPYLSILVLAAILGFSFMGSRSLFEPDEGRYTNVALNIVDSNEWISLYRHPDSLHFTKPPLTYWMIAGSVKVFGFNTWAARLPIALAYLSCVLLVFQLGKIFVREKPWLPALIYASSPFPFLASNYISTDYVLAACVTLAIVCFSRYAFLKKSRFWMDAMWAALGLAFLAKGPPGLLPLLAITAVLWQQKDLKALFRPMGLLAFGIIGLAWYGIVIMRHPGLLDYFIGHEVVNRVAGDGMKRSSEWYGAFKVYFPVLVFGALPWLILARKQLFKTLGHWSSQSLETRFLWLSFLIPLIIFSLSQSRMPLYLLPVFTVISLLLARAMSEFEMNPRKLALVALWMMSLIGMRYGLSIYEHRKDPEVFGEKIMALTKEAPKEIIFVEDMTLYGLHLYLGSRINKVSFKPDPKRISDSRFDMTLAEALAQEPGKRIFIFKRENEQYFISALTEKNLRPLRLGVISDHKKRPKNDRLVYTIPGEFEFAK